jgi:hypothetical protein
MRRLPPADASTAAGLAARAPGAAQAPIDAPPARPAARVGGGGAMAAAPMIRRNAERSVHTISSTVSTPVTVREASGGVTPLSAYAPASTALGGPNGVPEAVVPARGVLGRAAQALRDCFGMAEPVEWLQERIRTLRGEALTGHPPEAGIPPVAARLLLGRRAEPQPVGRFWGQAPVSGRINLGQHHDALVDKLDLISQAHGPHVGLGLSFALLSAQRAAGGCQPPDVDVLEAFDGQHPAAAILAAAADVGAPEAHHVTALNMLREAARSNQF